MSPRIQPMNFSKYGRIGSPADGRSGATAPRNNNINYPTQASFGGRHQAHPEYYTSLQQPIAKKNKMMTTGNSPQNHSPPVPAILTSAASFDSGITTVAGQSPGRHGRATTSRTANVALPRSIQGPLPPLSQHILSYPPPGVMASEGYSYHFGRPPLNRNNTYGEIYYQHPNTMQHGLPSDPFLQYHHATQFNGHHYYPYGQPWHLLQQNAHESSSRQLPPMVVSSSSVVNTNPVAPLEYVTDLREHDVLSGRGGATNSYRGNRSFRILVKEYQDQYLKAKKRDKPAVASLIVETIRKRGGRFLRRDTSQFRRRPNRNDGFDNGGSMIQWVDIGDERAREKTCQALREGAPEMRRQGHRGSDTDRNRSWDAKYRNDSSLSFDDDADFESGSREKELMTSVIKDTRLARPSEQYENDCYYWQGSSKDRHGRDNVGNDSDVDDSTPEVRNGGRHPVEEITISDEEEVPILIRPWSRLLPDRPPVEPIGLHQLSVQDRDIYLREFLPPNPRYEMEHHRDQHDGCQRSVHRDNNEASIRYNVEEHNNHDEYMSNHDEKVMAIRKHDGKGSQWPLVTA